MEKLGTIHWYSHFIQLSLENNRVREALRYYIKKNLVAKQLSKQNGKWVVENGKVYSFTTEDKSVIHIHINNVNDLREHLITFGIDLDDDFEQYKADFTDYNTVKVDIKVKDKFIPFDYQEEIIAQTLEPGYRKVTNLSMGYG